MTPPTARERAKRIGKKAVSDDYVEDGGYILDWLVNDIVEALESVERETLERAANIAYDYWEKNKQRDGMSAVLYVRDEIRSLLPAPKPRDKEELK